MSRRKGRPGPKVKRTFDFSKITASACALRGHGDCDDDLQPIALIDIRKRKAVPNDLIAVLCGGHRAMQRRERLGERIGIWVPTWVWNQAGGDPLRQAAILKEMGVMRSTARAGGELEWPYWMRNEKEAHYAELDRLALVAEHDRHSDLRLDAMHAHISEQRAIASMGLEPGTPLTVQEVRHSEDGVHVVATLADGRTVLGFDPVR